ncbi:hypothetical protein BGW36DRAFT_126130 [Talaromyces proteolyticus]|uniref:Uncharacterized protein n=1 Tax=Talaromyces proteolyticus TaxID=1131652 RepID=A0AAD4Q2E0_9EURO|nr:uncharacterized protein BGW36DRAFT_126130 [Talaromyces proteolyticus]KAH8700281.1 hypothetical protein BGW36DRAFT_126130 [Talaromyces proteolyticus]
MAPTKPILHPLKTPKSTTFPSEIHDGPASARPDIKHEDSSATPISPPLAYTEFLKALTPVFNSPMSPAMSFPKFPIEKSRTPTSQPSTASSASFPSSDFIKSATISPQSPMSAKSFSGRRRLRISTAKVCGKTFSPTTPATDSPLSALSALSATSMCSPFSPSDWKLHYSDVSRNSTGKPVSVRQVVTRTVTYKRTPLDPPPRGKRRKTGESK